MAQPSPKEQPKNEPREYPPPPGVRSAIVTGGSSGIGKAAALALALAGWNVLISGRRIDVLQQAVNDIESKTREEVRNRSKVRLFVGDTSEEESVQRMFADAQEAFGQIDLVFINAGISARAVPIQELSFKEWSSVMDVNINGAWLCAREAFRYMDGSKNNKLVGGRIILNGSISAHVPRPHSSPYTASKHAISGLTKSLSLDGRKYYIAVSQIDIGNAVSSMTSRMVDNAGVLQADGVTYATEPRFDTEHAGSEIVHIASMPLSVNVQTVMLMATNMPFIGRG